jgi:hypothetical protein
MERLLLAHGNGPPFLVWLSARELERLFTFRRVDQPLFLSLVHCDGFPVHNNLTVRSDSLGLTRVLRLMALLTSHSALSFSFGNGVEWSSADVSEFRMNIQRNLFGLFLEA